MTDTPERVKEARSGKTRRHFTGRVFFSWKLRDEARELASQDACALVERFGHMGRRKLQLAG